MRRSAPNSNKRSIRLRSMKDRKPSQASSVCGCRCEKETLEEGSRERACSALVYLLSPDGKTGQPTSGFLGTRSLSRFFHTSPPLPHLRRVAHPTPPAVISLLSALTRISSSQASSSQPTFVHSAFSLLHNVSVTYHQSPRTT